MLEDDLDLLNENFGRNVGGRVEISDDDEDDRERIKGALFGHVCIFTKNLNQNFRMILKQRKMKRLTEHTMKTL